MATEYLNYIGGQWVPARSGKQFTNVNPATGEALGQFPDSGPDDVDAAVTAARGAMRAWQLTPATPMGTRTLIAHLFGISLGVVTP